MAPCHHRNNVQHRTIISLHPTLSHLAEVITDPENNDGCDNARSCKVERLVVLTCGVKTAAKYTILNSCFLIYAQDLKMKKYKHVDITAR